MLIYFFGLWVKLLGYDLQKQWETQTEQSLRDVQGSIENKFFIKYW